jgi:hypothetical protein
MAIRRDNVQLVLEIEAQDGVRAYQKLLDESKKVTNQMRNLKRAGKENSEEFKQLQKRASELNQEMNELGGAGANMAQLITRSKQLNQELKSLVPGTKRFIEVTEELKQVNSRLKDIREQTRGVSSELEEMRIAGIKVPPAFVKIANGIETAFKAFFALQIVQFFIEWGNQVSALTREYQKLQGQIEQTTGASGQQLDDYTVQLSAISRTFKVENQEIINAATALTKQLTGDFGESLRLIEQGFVAGANRGGDFLDQVKEYPAFFREAELTGEQMIATITQSVQEGVFSDKGADLIKEFTLRVRELTPATQAALEGIGITSEQIRKKIEEEGIGAAFEMVQTQLRKLEQDSPAVGAALADIFGGPGEDAGIQFVENLNLADASMEKLTDTSNEYVMQQQALLEAERQLSEAQLQLTKVSGQYVNQLQILGTKVLATVISGVSKFLNIIKETPAFLKENRVIIGGLAAGIILLNKQLIISSALSLKDAAAKKAAIIATQAQTIATRGLNAVMRANPIGVVITALSLLAGAIKIAYDRSQTFRAVIAGTFGVLQEFGQIIKESFSNFLGIFSDLSEGNIKSAFERFKKSAANTNPISFFRQQGGRLKEAFIEGYNDKLQEEMIASTEEAIPDAEVESLSAQAKNLGNDLGRTTGEEFKKSLQKEAPKVQREEVSAMDIGDEDVDSEIVDNAFASEQELLKNRFLQALMTEQEYYDQRYELQQQDYERRLDFLQEKFGEESAAYIQLENEKLEKQKDYEMQRQELTRRTEDIRAQLMREGVNAVSDLVGTTIDLLGQEDDERKKNSLALKAFSAGKVLIDTQEAIMAIIKNAEANPQNILFPAAGKIISGIKIAAVSAKSLAALNKIRGTSFYSGGHTGDKVIMPDAYGGIVGAVHKNEWVAPDWMTGHPVYGQTIGWLEAMRQRGFKDGGFTTINTTPTLPVSNTLGTAPDESRELMMMFLKGNDQLIKAIQRKRFEVTTGQIRDGLQEEDELDRNSGF